MIIFSLIRALFTKISFLRKALYKVLIDRPSKLSNKKVLSVNQKGKITAKHRGKAVVYAKATDGSKKYGKCIVTVKQPVKKIKLSDTSLTLKVGKSEKIKAISLLRPKRIKRVENENLEEIPEKSEGHI